MTTRTWKTYLVELLLLCLVFSIIAQPLQAQDPHVIIRNMAGWSEQQIINAAVAVGADPWPWWDVHYCSGYSVYAFGPAVPQPEVAAEVPQVVRQVQPQAFTPGWNAYAGTAFFARIAQIAPVFFGLTTYRPALYRYGWATGPVVN